MTKTLIIAEAGVNHNGDLNNAKELISEAAKCGADIIKFQTFKSEKLVTSEAKKTTYQIQNTKNNSTSQKSMLSELELKDEDHIILDNHCKKNNIEFLSTAFDIKSLEMLINVGIKRIKIPSGEITNLPYLRAVREKNLPLILSTGMSTLEEVNDAIKVLTEKKLNKNSITVLHCTSEYPAPLENINLKAMKSLRNKLNIEVGYSDHSIGIEVALCAVSLGAKIIEKHITLDKRLPGPDHSCSLEPNEFARMVKSIRNIELCLGTEIKKPSEQEILNSIQVRKSIVASRKINFGEHFSEKNLTCKRPFNGISPMKWDTIIGMKSNKYYEKDDPIKLE